MDVVRSHILRLLKRQELKPGELASKLGISRQTLHRHVRELVSQKSIEKHGMGAHVVYAAVPDDGKTTRVRDDEVLCRTRLLPHYLDDYADMLTKYARSRTTYHTTVGDERAINFGFLLDAAAVYSSNIEGNTLDLNSFLNSRMAPRKHRPKEAREIEDLVTAYEFARKHPLDETHMLRAHKILSKEFVAPTRQGKYRKERVGVFSRRGLEYMAVEPHLVAREMHTLYEVVRELLVAKHTPAECFFWATWLHLMIALIHPFADGNGRTARLCEKWFLVATLGREVGFSVPSEEHYWKSRPQYYAALKLGMNYWEADMGGALPFFRLLPKTLARMKME